MLVYARQSDPCWVAWLGLASIQCHLLAQGLNEALLLILLHSNDTERTPMRSCWFPLHNFNIHSDGWLILQPSHCTVFPKLHVYITFHFQHIVLFIDNRFFFRSERLRSLNQTKKEGWTEGQFKFTSVHMQRQNIHCECAVHSVDRVCPLHYFTQLNFKVNVNVKFISTRQKLLCKVIH